mmetsp:Transcript_25699/g.44834  ORF Transcript_25699/g.44834 Transcript_25699/m.44834 type:complete len:198 (+) Transcript_25699:179-772(+)
MAFHLPVEKDKTKANAKVAFTSMPGNTTENVEELGLDYGGNGVGHQFIAGFTASDRMHAITQQSAALAKLEAREREDAAAVQAFRAQAVRKHNEEEGSSLAPKIALPEKQTHRAESNPVIQVQLKLKKRKHTKDTSENKSSGPKDSDQKIIKKKKKKKKKPKKAPRTPDQQEKKGAGGALSGLIASYNSDSDSDQEN